MHLKNIYTLMKEDGDSPQLQVSEAGDYLSNSSFLGMAKPQQL